MELKNPTVRSKVMALRSLQCIDQCVIPVFMISQPFQLRFRPMNSHWNKNWIIFAMELASTHLVIGSKLDGIDFIAPGAKIKALAIVRPPTAFQWPPASNPPPPDLDDPDPFG